MFNLKNEECQKAFRDATTGTNNNNYLSKVFDEEGDVNSLTEKFMKRLNKIINKCFRKIRVTERMDKNKEELFEKWRKMKNNLNDKNKSEFEELESKITEKYAEEFMKKIKEKTGGMY